MIQGDKLVTLITLNKFKELCDSKYLVTIEDLEYIREAARRIMAEPNHVFLTQELYESLADIDQNTLYFIVENSNWTFGNTFPIIFAGTDDSIGTFPITLTENGIGTFPITLSGGELGAFPITLI